MRLWTARQTPRPFNLQFFVPIRFRSVVTIDAGPHSRPTCYEMSAVYSCRSA